MAENAASFAPADPAPQRAGTILGRLAAAVREQNWFAVGLELVIVVLGVVVGFQVTGWGQNRADRAKETAYTRQILADVRATEQNLDSTIVLNEAVIGTVDSLLAAFDASPAWPDSVLDDLFSRIGWETAYPTTGTARAIVVTGDLNLITGDTERSAVIRLADLNERFAQDQNEISIELSLPVYREVFRRLRPRARAGDRYAVRHSDLLRDPAYYESVQELLLASRNVVRVQMEYRREVGKVRAILERGRDS